MIIHSWTDRFWNRSESLLDAVYNFVFVLKLACFIMPMSREQSDCISEAWRCVYVGGGKRDIPLRLWSSCCFSGGCIRRVRPRTSNRSYTFKCFVCAKLCRRRAALRTNFTTVCDGGWTDQYFIPSYVVRYVLLLPIGGAGGPTLFQWRALRSLTVNCRALKAGTVSVVTMVAVAICCILVLLVVFIVLIIVMGQFMGES
jgi:hypothetical protein